MEFSLAVQECNHDKNATT